jgi:pimeloyl-ACP methyl ester carboxylesterase
MLHGYLSCKESFVGQIAFFSRYMRVIAVDMTGFGKATKLDSAYSLEDYAIEIKILLDKICEEKVDLLAHSFGARVSVKLLQKESRIDKIIFTGAAGLKPRRSFKYFFRKASFFILKNFVKKEKLKFLYSKDYRNLSPIMKCSFQKIIAENLDNQYKNISNKTLLIFGKKDRETPPYMAKRMKKLLKRSKLCFLRNAGHFCFLEKPDEFNSLALKFLMEKDDD